MIHIKIHLISPGCPRPSIALQVQNRGLKQFHFIQWGHRGSGIAMDCWPTGRAIDAAPGA